MLLVFFNSHAQYENVWAFGSRAGLDFNSGSPRAIATNIAGWGEANASVCDHNGQLLFYTEGSYVWDKNGNLMPNGSNLTLMHGATSSASQGALIVPSLENAPQYYIFSLTAHEEGDSMGRLYYSLVDMELNGGLGDIVPNQKGILLDSNLLERMTAIVGDRCNIWLLTQTASEFKAFEIAASGINTIPVLSEVLGGMATSFTGSIVASPNRKKVAVAQCNIFGLGINGAAIYDFNPATGSLSNPLQLSPANSGYGACFSPDNTKLYINQGTRQRVLQYDLSHDDPDDIIRSETVIGQSGLTQLKLGPDGKIYLLGNDGYLSVINFPNLVGAACQFVPNAIPLLDETSTNLGLPHTVPIMRYDTSLTTRTIEAGCFVTELLLTANEEENGMDYIWNNGSTGPRSIADTAGVYWVRYHTPPCVYHVDTFKISFPNGVLPTLEIEPACKGDGNGKAFAYSPPYDTLGYTFIWRNAENQVLSTSDTLHSVPSGSYTLQISSAHCDTILELVIPEEEYHVSFNADSIICEGGRVEFQNTSNSHFTQFHWTFGDNAGSSLPVPSHSYDQAGKYEISLTGIGEVCQDTARQFIVVDPQMEAHFVADKDSICIGQSIMLTHEMDGATVTDLNWQLGDEYYLSTLKGSLRHAYEHPGIIPITLSSQFRVCPASSFTDTVFVFDLPKVDLGSDTSLCLNGAPIILKNRLPSSNLQRFLWNTGDTTETLQIVLPGSYSLQVSETPIGCSNTETIEVRKGCLLDIPNAFSPNGDGENDYFFPRRPLSKDITRFRMQILNRWGKVVFETNSINGRGWDGRFNNQEQPTGVYVYHITVEIQHEGTERYQGNVTLIR